VMKRVPRLATLRYQICPLKITDHNFWYVYFTLVKKRIGKLLEDSSPDIVNSNWEELKRQERKQEIIKTPTTKQRMQEMSLFNLWTTNLPMGCLPIATVIET